MMLTDSEHDQAVNLIREYLRLYPEAELNEVWHHVLEQSDPRWNPHENDRGVAKALQFLVADGEVVLQLVRSSGRVRIELAGAFHDETEEGGEA